jgi:hypothetical protein
MEVFQQTQSDCELYDLGYEGAKYTLNNCHDIDTFSCERLDRGLANNLWCALFSRVEISIEVVVNSDHHSLILYTNKMPNGPKRRRRFMYDATWG